MHKLTTVLGLPISDVLEPGIHHVPLLMLGNMFISPCYVQVDEVSESETKISFYGVQPHLMNPVRMF